MVISFARNNLAEEPGKKGVTRAGGVNHGGSGGLGPHNVVRRDTQGAVSADAVDWKRGAFMASLGHMVHDKAHIPFAVDKVRFPGEPVAMVVAETREQARDAAEALDVTYAILPAVVDGPTALKPGAPQLWDDVPGNLALDADVNDRTGIAEAFASAAHIVEERFRSQRTVTAQMEPRAALGQYDPATGHYLLTSGCQGAHRMRVGLCAAMKLTPDRLRVVVPDVGGGFGTRTNSYTEQLGVLWAARVVGRPVKWTGDRNECFLTDYQGRDLDVNVELALDKDGKFLAVRGVNLSNLGAYATHFTPLRKGLGIMQGVYNIPAVHFRGCGVLTNTVPTTPYRSAGRPEAIYVIERLVDLAADLHGFDPIELRRRNFIQPETMPFTNAVGITYDNGEYERVMDMALKLADWDNFAKRRAEARAPPGSLTACRRPGAIRPAASRSVAESCV